MEKDTNVPDLNVFPFFCGHSSCKLTNCWPLNWLPKLDLRGTGNFTGAKALSPLRGIQNYSLV